MHFRRMVSARGPEPAVTMVLLERNLGTDLDALLGEILASVMPPGRPGGGGDPPPGGGDAPAETEDKEDEAE